MHGRIKTITTEEQKARLLKSRQEKVKVYLNQYKEIIINRCESGKEEEVLKLTSDVLLANPDIATLWNVRRELILKNADMQSVEFQERLKNELSLTKQCLVINPKSYCAWHHRLWCLGLLPEVWWNKELEICDLYLTKDERNFHCWDYRKIVAEKAKVSLENELQFTKSKLESNFSNYSAWHFRSKLLPKLFPDNDNNFSVSESCLKEELETVQAAVYTDPGDQSAWFYQRWLLGFSQPRSCIVRAQIVNASVLIALSEGVKQISNWKVNAYFEDKLLTKDCLRLTAESNRPLFRLVLDEIPDIVTIRLEKSDELSSVILDEIAIDISNPYARPFVLPELSQASKLQLNQELEQMKQLQELEPENKWISLALVDLMKAIDLSLYFGEITNLLTEVKKLDQLRTSFYDDILSKIFIEHKFLTFTTGIIFDIPNSSLSCFYHSQYLLLAKNVNLSGNRLRCVDLKNFDSLLNCEKLNLSNNCISSLKYLPVLHTLTFLDISNNALDNPAVDKEHLSLFKSLITINW